MNRRGETIAETLIALSVLAIGITMAGTALATSLKNVSSSKNREVAVSLAREGLEAVRNIRDTNWLKYSSRRRDCWNALPGSDCGQSIGAGYHQVTKGLGGWSLALIPGTEAASETADVLEILKGEKAPFYRWVKIIYPEEAQNRMEVTANVTWLQGGRESSVVLKTRLTDYLGRTTMTD